MPRRIKQDFEKLLRPSDDAFLDRLVVTCTAPGSADDWLGLLRDCPGVSKVKEEPYSAYGTAAIRGKDLGLSVLWDVHDGEHTDSQCAHWRWMFRRRRMTELADKTANFAEIFKAMMKSWPAPRRQHEFSIISQYSVEDAKPMRELQRLLDERINLTKQGDLALLVDELVFSASLEGTRRGLLSVSPSPGGSTLLLGWSGVLRRRMTANVFNVIRESSWTMASTVITGSGSR